MSHPDFLSWSGEPPDPREAGPGHKYACLDCAWIGRAVGAYNHAHAHPAHRVILRDAPQWGPVELRKMRITNA